MDIDERGQKLSTSAPSWPRPECEKMQRRHGGTIVQNLTLIGCFCAEKSTRSKRERAI